MGATEVYSKEAACGLYILSIVQGLVDKLHEVRISTEMHVDGDDRFTVNIAVATEDIGKVIGKQGRTARSIRTIISAYAMREKIKVQINIIDNKNPLAKESDHANY
jgi:uncharacterized protein